MDKKNIKNYKEVIEKANKESKDKKTVEEQIQLVVFELDKEEYGVEITELHEIIKIPDITPIPNAPAFICGILNLRGKIVVVLDLEKRFNLVRENDIKPTHIIISECKINNNTFGIIVDEVREVIRAPLSTIHPAPTLVTSKIHTDYLKGVAVLENQQDDESELKEKNPSRKSDSESRLIILLDLPKMLEEHELLKFGEKVKSDNN